MATAANDQTIGNTPAEGTQIFDRDLGGRGVRSFFVRCRSGSSNSVLVRITDMHKAGEFIAIPAGSEMVFRAGLNDINAVYAKGDSGDASIDYAVVAV